jgi:hypothetical protein
MPRNPLLRAPAAVSPVPPERYARFGWLRNPFPDVPYVIVGAEDPRSNGSIYADSVHQAEQQRFEELLVPTPDRPASRMAFLMDAAVGRGRGIGKTAFLNRQRSRIMSDLGWFVTRQTYLLFAAHILPPAGTNNRKFWQFARLLITSFNKQEVIAQLLWRLRAFSGLIPDAVLDEAEEVSSTVGDNDWLAEHHVPVEHELIPAIKERLTTAGVEPILAEGLATYGHSPEQFWTGFLRHITDYRWRQMAGTWLTNDLVSAFRLGGFYRGLVFVDDFEKIVNGQNTVERRTFADDIRYSFVEGPTRGAQTGFYSLLWVIHPYLQEILGHHWNAAGLDRCCAVTGDRSATCRIDFNPISAANAEGLVAEYIAHARQPNFQAADRLSPLTPAAVTEAFRITRQLPGHLLIWLNRVVEKAIDEQWPDFAPARLTQFAQAQPPALPDETPEVQPLAAPEADLREGGA